MSDRHDGEAKTAETTVSDLDARRAAIALRLKLARKMAGLSQGQVARLMGLHRPSISEAEAGRRKVSAEELADFAVRYGVSVAWLGGSTPLTVEPGGRARGARGA